MQGSPPGRAGTQLCTPASDPGTRRAPEPAPSGTDSKARCSGASAGPGTGAYVDGLWPAWQGASPSSRGDPEQPGEGQSWGAGRQLRGLCVWWPGHGGDRSFDRRPRCERCQQAGFQPHFLFVCLIYTPRSVGIFSDHWCRAPGLDGSRSPRGPTGHRTRAQGAVSHTG